MKILYITTISPTLYFMEKHIEMLNEQGHEVDVACNITSTLPKIIEDKSAEIFNIPFSRNPLSSNNIRAFKKLKKIFLKNNYDVIHTHTPIASFISRIAAKKYTKSKIIYTAHGFHFYKYAPLKNWLIYYPIEKVSLRWTDIVITMNEEDYSRAKSMSKMNRTRVKYIPGVGLDLKKFEENKKMKRSYYGFKDDEFLLVYAGELNDNKNQKLLINMFYLLQMRIPNSKLLLLGRGKNKSYYEKLIDEKGLTNKIQLLGYRKDVIQIMSISDLYVASSLREGLPVNIMEAMGCRLPIVATNVRGHRDLIINGSTGILVENDEKVFCENVVNLYDNKKLREKMGKSGYKRLEKFDIDKVLIRLAQIYNDLEVEIEKDVQ